MTCWITLNVDKASLTHVLDKTSNGAAIGLRCHSMMRSRDNRCRSMPDRFVAKYRSAKLSVLKLFRSYAALVGDDGWITMLTLPDGPTGGSAAGWSIDGDVGGELKTSLCDVAGLLCSTVARLLRALEPLISRPRGLRRSHQLVRAGSASPNRSLASAASVLIPSPSDG